LVVAHSDSALLKCLLSGMHTALEVNLE